MWTCTFAQWVRVRTILRPKLSQRLAEEAQAREARLKAEKDGVVSGLGEEDHKEEHVEDHEEEEEERERREKEEKEKEQKEKEKQEKEKERQEKEKLVEAQALTRRGSAAAEVGGAPAPNETTKTEDEDDEDDDKVDDDDDDDDEDYEPLFEVQPEDVEYEGDPFYGRPWDTEVPKVGERTGAGIRCGGAGCVGNHRSRRVSARLREAVCGGE